MVCDSKPTRSREEKAKKIGDEEVEANGDDGLSIRESRLHSFALLLLGFGQTGFWDCTVLHIKFQWSTFVLIGLIMLESYLYSLKKLKDPLLDVF